MGTVYPKKYAHGFCFAVLCCGYTLTAFPISIRLTSLALWQSNDCPVPAKQPWWIWINTSCEFIVNDCITTTNQSTTKPCAYSLGHTVSFHNHAKQWNMHIINILASVNLGHRWVIRAHATWCTGLLINVLVFINSLWKNGPRTAGDTSVCGTFLELIFAHSRVNPKRNKHQIFNATRAKFTLRNINMRLQFLPYQTGMMVTVVEIIPCGRQLIVYRGLRIPFFAVRNGIALVISYFPVSALQATHFATIFTKQRLTIE